MTNLKPWLALVAVAMLTVACNDDNDGGEVSQGVDTLGSDFAEAFDADPNDEPINAQDVDLEVDPTIDPFDI